MNKLKIIKFAVFCMTTMLLMGLIFCAKMIYDRSRPQDIKLEDINLNQPFGSKIKNVLAV